MIQTMEYATASAIQPRVGSALRFTMLLALVGPALTFVVLPPALPLISSHFSENGDGASIAQLAQALPFLGLALGGLLAGRVIRTIGNRNLLLLAAAVYFMSGTSGFFMEASPLLLTGCFGIGLAAALLSSGLVTLTGAVISEAHRPRMLGYQTAVSDFSTVTFGLVSAWIAQSWGWHGPFVVYAAYGLLVLVLCSFGTPDKQMPAEPTDGGILQTLRLVWPVYLGAAFVFFLTVTQTIQLPFLLAQHGLETPISRSIVLTCSTAAATLGALTYALCYGRLGTTRLRLIATFSATLGFVGFAVWSGGMISAALAALLVGFGIGLSVPSLFAAALRRSPPALRGHSIGLLNTSIFLGSFLSPVIFTPLVAAIGYSSSFIVAGLLVAAAGIFSIFLAERRSA